MNNILRNPELRKKILFTLFIIVVFRILAHVPVPGVDTSAIKAYLSQNTLLGLYDLFSGGAFQNFSVVTLGLNPYINASIIIQLFTMMIPSLEELSKEGEAGREQLNMYTKVLTIPLSLLQGYGMYFLLTRQAVISQLNMFQLVILIITLMTGSMLLMWLGDLVTEYGIGQGISILIFVGIIGRLPIHALQLFGSLTSDNLLNLVLFALITFLIICGVVLVNEGERKIQIQYGRMGAKGGNVTNYLPLKINQAGVIPIIFAVSIMMLPSILSGPLQAMSNSNAQAVGRFLQGNFSETAFIYNLVYFLLVVGFTYFYTSVQFNSVKIADDIKKRGGFITGIRPGSATAKYLGGIVSRITLFGGIFLGLIAILPQLVQNVLGISNFAVGGTSLLIVVSVVLETIRQGQSMLVTRNYYSFLE